MTTNVDPKIASEDFLGCEIIDQLNDKLRTTTEGSPLTGNLPPIQDVKSVYMLLKGYSQVFFPVIPYQKLLTTAAEIDEVHGEIQEAKKRWADAIQVRAFAVPTEITQPSTRFGIEDVRQVQLLITVPDLVASKLATQDESDYEIKLVGRIGDMFWYHRRQYSVTTVVPAAWWANTDIPLYYQLKSELRRGNAADEWGLI